MTKNPLFNRIFPIDLVSEIRISMTGYKKNYEKDLDEFDEISHPLPTWVNTGLSSQNTGLALLYRYFWKTPFILTAFLKFTVKVFLSKVSELKEYFLKKYRFFGN